MSTLPLKSREQFVIDEIAAIQAQLPDTYQFTLGSIVLAIVEAHGATAIWEESLIQFVLARTRLATSQGTDCDTFVADFGLSRLPAVAATTSVIFSSYSVNQQRIVPVGATVTTQAGITSAVSYAVTIDITNPAYNPLVNGYVMAINTPSVTVPVQCTVAGIVGNVPANTVTVINSPIPSIDTVTNPSPVDTGLPAQTDTQLRTYFVAYLNGLARATQTALGFAIQSVQEGLEYLIVENTDYASQTEVLGQFYAIVDDGSGDPPDQLLTQVRTALNNYRGLSIRYAVYPPIIVDATVTATIVFPTIDQVLYVNPDIVPAANAAVNLYISLIPFGGTLFYGRLYHIIYNVINNIVPDLVDLFDITDLLLNGDTVDLTSLNTEAIRPLDTDITEG